MKDRIRQIMDTLGLSQKEFAEKLKISEASISNIFTGRSNPTAKHVQAIHNAFPSINTNWVMFGEGNMLESQTPTLSAAEYQSQGAVAGSAASAPASYSSPLGGVSATQEPASGDGAENAGSDEVLDLFSALGERQAAAAAKPDGNAKPVAKAVKETKIVRRRIVEIRVFFDDQTFESFVPSRG